MNARPILVAIFLAAGCSSSTFTPAPPIDCSKTQCSCEQDPQQLTCRGFDGVEAGPGATTDATVDAADGAFADASDEGPTDGGVDGDADASLVPDL